MPRGEGATATVRQRQGRKGRDVLETPVYSIGEAARSLDVPTATLRYWVLGGPYKTQRGLRRAAPVIELADPTERLLSFLNLVEAHVLDALRRYHEVSLPKIRTALDYLERSKVCLPSGHARTRRLITPDRADVGEKDRRERDHREPAEDDCGARRSAAPGHGPAAFDQPLLAPPSGDPVERVPAIRVDESQSARKRRFAARLVDDDPPNAQAPEDACPLLSRCAGIEEEALSRLFSQAVVLARVEGHVTGRGDDDTHGYVAGDSIGRHARREDDVERARISLEGPRESRRKSKWVRFVPALQMGEPADGDGKREGHRRECGPAARQPGVDPRRANCPQDETYGGADGREPDGPGRARRRLAIGKLEAEARAERSSHAEEPRPALRPGGG